MPMFDYRCAAGHIFEQFVHRRNQAVRCACGEPTEVVWLPGSAPTVIDDTIPGGRWVENLGPRPKRYDSKSDIRRDMDALGVQPKVQHIGEPGSDRSKHTTRWI